jgi:hypothetical protein
VPAPLEPKPVASTADNKPHSAAIASNLCGKLSIYYAGLSKGSGRYPVIKRDFDRWVDDARGVWGEMNSRDQVRVKKERLKLEELIAEHEALQASRKSGAAA